MVKELPGKGFVIATVLSVLGLGSLGCGQSTGSAAEATDAAAKELPPTCAIIGGSVSSGMAWKEFEHLSTEADPITFCEKQFKRRIEEREYDLRTDAISAYKGMVRIDRSRAKRLRNYSKMFYRNPDRIIANMLHHATRKKYRLIVGMDMLVWYAYGNVKLPKRRKVDRAKFRADARYAALQRAFRMIDKYAKGSSSTFVVGDIPDLSNGNQILLPPDQRPTPAVLAELNRRLHAFAAKRHNVIIFPLERLLREAVKETLEVTVDGKPHIVRSADALQFDEFHPNRIGMALLLMELYASVKRDAPDELVCLPEMTDFATVCAKLGTSIADLEYLGTRARKKGRR